MISRPLTLPWQEIPSTLAGEPMSLRMASSLIRTPETAGRLRTPGPLNPATGWITEPAGDIDVCPLIPLLMPASSVPSGMSSGASVYQSPGPSRTLPPPPTLPSAVLIAAVSVAPVLSVDGMRTMVDAMEPPPADCPPSCRHENEASWLCPQESAAQHRDAGAGV